MTTGAGGRRYSAVWTGTRKTVATSLVKSGRAIIVSRPHWVIPDEGLSCTLSSHGVRRHGDGKKAEIAALPPALEGGKALVSHGDH